MGGERKGGEREYERERKGFPAGVQSPVLTVVRCH